jgi:outer membrane protein
MRIIFSVLISYFFIFFPQNSINKPLINNDLKKSLESLYNFNPKLKYERQILKSKDEMMPQALSEFRPEIKGYYKKGKVDTNSEGFNITSDGIRTETNKGITITQEIFDGGSSLSNLKVAENVIISQRFFLKDKEQEIFFDAIKIYANYATERTNHDLKLKNVEVLENRLELTKEEFDIGEVTLTDVSIAEARLSLAESELIESEKNLQSLISKFSFTFGIKPMEPQIELTLFEFPDGLEKMKHIALKENPKINDVIFQIKSIENEIKKLKRKKLPSVKFEADAYINEGYFRTDSKREVLSAFATVDIPLYQSGTASSKIRETKSKLYALRQLLKQVRDDVIFNLISSKSSFEHSFSKISAYKKQIESNKIYLDGLRQEMQLGERTMLDLLDGEQELLQSELDLVKSHRDFFNSYYEILFFMGSLNAKKLDLSVNYYDETKNYKDVKYKWLDIVE